MFVCATNSIKFTSIVVVVGGIHLQDRDFKRGCIKRNTICMTRYHNEEDIRFLLCDFGEPTLIPRINHTMGFNSN